MFLVLFLNPLFSLKGILYSYSKRKKNLFRLSQNSRQIICSILQFGVMDRDILVLILFYRRVYHQLDCHPQIIIISLNFLCKLWSVGSTDLCRYVGLSAMTKQKGRFWQKYLLFEINALYKIKLLKNLSLSLSLYIYIYIYVCVCV